MRLIDYGYHSSLEMKWFYVDQVPKGLEHIFDENKFSDTEKDVNKDDDCKDESSIGNINTKRLLLQWN